MKFFAECALPVGGERAATVDKAEGLAMADGAVVLGGIVCVNEEAVAEGGGNYGAVMLDGGLVVGAVVGHGNKSEARGGREETGRVEEWDAWEGSEKEKGERGKEEEGAEEEEEKGVFI